MDNLSTLKNQTFDIVHQPVNTYYVTSLDPIFTKITRVLHDNNLYINQHKQPTSLQVSHQNRHNQYMVAVEYYHKGPLPEVPNQSYHKEKTVKYLHR